MVTTCVSLYCTVSDIATYWSKIADLNLPHHYLRPPLPVGVTPGLLEFRRDLWLWQTRVPLGTALFV